MNEFVGVMGTFADADALRAAVVRAREAGLPQARAYLPLGDRSVEDRIIPAGSHVSFVAAAGMVAGIGTALLMTIWMSQDYPLITGGKPIVSYPPFLVVTFELFVLLGGISSVLGALWLGRLPRLTPSDAYRPEMAVDTFALFVPCAEASDERARADRVLREAGAAQVEDVRRHNYTELADTAADAG